ncbi:hypothetical protein QE152_g19079 [Popillia japonica]|uniref:Uncharacterized protein n=1 Tax=Popillia japonica TaxID=7064 RepID=A0AAW1L4H7_POPJA
MQICSVYEKKSQHLLTRPMAEGVDQFPGASASQCSTVIESTDDDLLMLNDNPEALDIQRINCSTVIESTDDDLLMLNDNPEALDIQRINERSLLMMIC